MSFDPIEKAITEIASGGMAIVVDDEDRENEGDLVMAAEAATPEALAFIIRNSSGVVCAALPPSRLDHLQLPLMVADNTETLRTAYTVTVDYRHGTSTGISAADRAATLRALADPSCSASDFNRPGHVFPLRAISSGVLGRPGHTEASVDLTRIAGLTPGGVICEIMNDDGSMSRLPQLRVFADRHRMPIVSIADLIAYRKRTERIVRRLSEARLPTRYGVFTVTTFLNELDGLQHLALTMGNIRDGGDVLARVHSECLTGDILGSLRCDCGAQLDLAMSQIAREGRGCVVYLRGHEGRGVGLAHKIQAYALQDTGLDTVVANEMLGLPVDSRDYTVGAQIISELGIRSLRLMTNNPAKYSGIQDFGLVISKQIPLLTSPNPENLLYLRAKQEKLGHRMFEENGHVDAINFSGR